MILKQEAECTQLRNQVVTLTDELKQTKLKLNEMTFELIKCDEQLKSLDQKNLKI